jgi:maltooligosyltrehalose trehalohydrolase
MEYRFGPIVGNDGVLFRLYAPAALSPRLHIDGHHPITLNRSEGGFWTREVAGVQAGTRYRFESGGLLFPDLASRRQDEDTAGWSIVCEPFAPAAPTTPLRPWHESIICEVHVGTATPDGTFAALRERLEHFRDAGYTCLEIMPVNAYPGKRNWGYDGTLIFAPASAYGTPEDLRELIERAHQLGLSMVLDVVYNHFGSTHNFARDYVPEWFSPDVDTPWGPGINFDNPQVRQFYYENAAMWLGEYGFDGLRFDSVHEMKTGSRQTFLDELAATARSVKPRAILIIENMTNSFDLLKRGANGEPQRYLAQWNDDMHHVLTYLVTGEGARTGYDKPDADPYADLEKALANGFVHDPTEGEGSDGRTRGGRAADLPPDSFITYVQNHDQIGNRADSKRIAERISPEQLDFIHFVKFLAPQIPLCFMGDEGNLTSPFPFFFDLPEPDATEKAADRYTQMREIFTDEVADGDLPDPNAEATFLTAKLPWSDYEELQERRDALDRFRTLAGWRQRLLWPLAKTPCLDAVTVRHGNALIINWVFEAGTLSMSLNPTDKPLDIPCILTAMPVSTGDFQQQGDLLRLGPWAAVAWTSFATQDDFP